MTHHFLLEINDHIFWTIASVFDQFLGLFLGFSMLSLGIMHSFQPTKSQHRAFIGQQGSSQLKSGGGLPPELRFLQKKIL